MKKKWLSAAAAAVLSVCALAAPISVPNTVTPVAVQAASSGTTLGNDLRPDRRRKRNTQVCCKMAEQTDDHTGAAEAAANRSGNGSERLD